MADEQLKREIDAYVDEVWEDVVADIATLVEVDSVEDRSTAREGAPFGEGPRVALDRALAIAARMGLDAHDCEGHIGYADLPGKSEEQLALIAHLDIVPAGDGWRHGPFELAREEGCLIGRGVEDDKGPATLALYATKFFHDRGEELPYTIRLLFGVNEETHMADVDYYLEHYPMPAFTITPDATFPVCYGEKGCYWADVASAPLGPDARIVEASGGIVANAVPDGAYAVVRADAAALPAAERIKVEPAGEGLARVEAAGVAAHASKPQGSVNAILVLVDYLRAHGIASPEERAFLDLEHEVLGSWDGSGIGIAASDDDFGPLTIVGGMLRLRDGRLVQTVDSRFPATVTAERITGAIESAAERCGAEVTVTTDEVKPPFITDPNSEQIRVLVDTYNEVAGKDDKPFTMGGGTYARKFAKAASYGPGGQGIKKPDWVNSEHRPNEGIREDALKQALRVYILAIARLMRTEL